MSLSIPHRIQRCRMKGWRMPTDAIYVGRPTMFGNPFLADHNRPERELAAGRYRGWLNGVVLFNKTGRTGIDWVDAAIDRGATISDWPDVVWAKRVLEALVTLRGHDLACWCPLDQPCHADVLLELANDIQLAASSLDDPRPILRKSNRRAAIE